MSIESRLCKACDRAEEQAFKKARRLMKYWNTPEGKDCMEYELKELCRVAMVREEFLKHPWMWLFVRIKLKFSVYKIKIEIKLRKLFKVRSETH